MSECMTKYSMRTYVDGDENELVQLFNRAYNGFVGFVHRTPDYWLWLCLNRPDVEANSIVIVTAGESIIGYGVVGKSGNIWELCYDSNYHGDQIVSMIMEWAVNYVECNGAESIALNAPQSDQLIRDVCLRFGFAETRPPSMFLNVLDLPQFIYELLKLKHTKLESYNETFLVKLRDCPTWCAKEFTIKVRNGNISVEEGLIAEHSVTIESDGTTLVSCILGTKGLLKAFLYFQVRVKPFWKTLKVLKLLSLLTIKEPWFVPRADFG